MKLFAAFIASTLFLGAVACGSGGDEGTGTAGGSALSGYNPPSQPAKAAPSASASSSSSPAAPAAPQACGGGDDGPSCAHGDVCKPNPGEENSLMPRGTCQKAAPKTQGADCKAPTDCNQGLSCLPDKVANDGTSLCALPDFGTEGGGCEGRTETPCGDGLTCVRANPDDLEGICQKQ